MMRGACVVHLSRADSGLSLDVLDIDERRSLMGLCARSRWFVSKSLVFLMELQQNEQE